MDCKRGKTVFPYYLFLSVLLISDLFHKHFCCFDGGVAYQKYCQSGFDSGNSHISFCYCCEAFKSLGVIIHINILSLLKLRGRCPGLIPFAMRM